VDHRRLFDRGDRLHRRRHVGEVDLVFDLIGGDIGKRSAG